MTQMWGTLQDVGVAVSRVFEMMAKLPEEKVRSGDIVPADAGERVRIRERQFFIR